MAVNKESDLELIAVTKGNDNYELIAVNKGSIHEFIAVNKGSDDHELIG